MKKKSSYLTLFILLSAFILSSCKKSTEVKKEITCNLKGTVINRNSDTIYLSKITDDERLAKIAIPIIDGHFEYHLTVPYSEAYDLIFKDELDQGYWRPTIFFPETDTVELTLYPFEDWENNIIKGGIINEQYNNYFKLFKSKFIPLKEPLIKEQDQLIAKNEYHSKELTKLFDKLDELSKAGYGNDSLVIYYRKIKILQKKGDDKTPKALSLSKKFDALNLKGMEWRYQYINEHPSIATYSLLIKDLLQKNKRDLISENYIKETYPILAEKFPDHPYTELAKGLIEPMNNIKIGGQFIDFSAPDLEGNNIKLSTIIHKNKATLLDLWATWCGPCISKSKKMIPVYNKYKDKGFTILSVAREKDNADRMKEAIKKYNFTWLNLLDINDKNKIWMKYGIPFSGGGIFLIANDGKIIAIDPTAEEVKEYMDSIQ